MPRHAVAPYAERSHVVPGGFDLGVTQLWGKWTARRVGGVARFARAVENAAAALSGLSDIALLAEAANLRPVLLRDAAVPLTRIFALVHVAVERNLGLRYY